MSALDPWRRALRARIPCGFLRRDQGAGLFISDYPRLGVEVDWAGTGFFAKEENGLARLDAAEEAYRALLLGLPLRDPAPNDETLFLFSLARRLEKSGAPFSPNALPIVRETLKYLDEGDLNGLYRFLSPAAAKAQRLHAPLPAALGRLILDDLWERQGKERSVSEVRAER